MMVNKVDNVLMCVQTTYDMVDYITNKPKPGFHAPWMDAIGEVASELEDNFFRSLKPKRGEYLYGDSAASNPKQITRRSTMIFWGESLTHFKYCGYKTLFLRSTNPRSTKLLVSLGG